MRLSTSQSVTVTACLFVLWSWLDKCVPACVPVRACSLSLAGSVVHTGDDADDADDDDDCCDDLRAERRTRETCVRACETRLSCGAMLFSGFELSAVASCHHCDRIDSKHHDSASSPSAAASANMRDIKTPDAQTTRDCILICTAMNNLNRDTRAQSHVAGETTRMCHF